MSPARANDDRATGTRCGSLFLCSHGEEHRQLSTTFAQVEWANSLIFTHKPTLNCYLRLLLYEYFMCECAANSRPCPKVAKDDETTTKMKSEERPSDRADRLRDEGTESSVTKCSIICHVCSPSRTAILNGTAPSDLALLSQCVATEYRTPRVN